MSEVKKNRVQEIEIPDEIFLPFNINKYDTESGVLLVAPEISSIVLTNEIGSYIVDVLRLNSNVDNAFYKAIEKFENVYTKEEVYKIIEKLAREGKSIIMISSEIEEVFRMSNRILVMSNGQIVSQYKNGDVSSEQIFIDSSSLLRERDYE